MPKNFKQILNDITTLIFDVDGVLTDGSVIIMPNGEKVRTLSSKDGFALQLAAKKGYNLCVITGGNSEQIKETLLGLGIQDVYLRASHKLEVLKDYLTERDLKPENCLYMGDDLPDYPVMQLVGLPCCPKDAAEEIKAISLYVSPLEGGKGCVRDIIEQVLKVNHQWMKDDGFSW